MTFVPRWLWSRRILFVCFDGTNLKRRFVTKTEEMSVDTIFRASTHSPLPENLVFAWPPSTQSRMLHEISPPPSLILSPFVSTFRSLNVTPSGRIGLFSVIGTYRPFHVFLRLQWLMSVNSICKRSWVRVPLMVERGSRTLHEISSHPSMSTHFVPSIIFCGRIGLFEYCRTCV